MSSLQASPMQLQYSITWEQYLTQDVVDEMVRQEANGRTHNCSCVKKKSLFFLKEFYQPLPPRLTLLYICVMK